MEYTCSESRWRNSQKVAICKGQDFDPFQVGKQEENWIFEAKIPC